MAKSRVSVLIAVAVTSGAVAAHFSGALDPVYHRLGWHSLVQHGDAPAATDSAANNQNEHGEHSGHESTSMPGMDMPDMEMPEEKAPTHQHTTGDSQPSGVPGHATISIAPDRQQLIGVRIGTVARDKLQMSIRAVGVVEPDQQRLARIHTRISGWVTKLYVDFVGQRVTKGQPLLEIYSPELVGSQEAYLIARERPQLGGVDASRQRLVLAGVASEEIAEIDRTGKARETLLLRAPIEGSVLERNVFEGSYVDPAAQLYQLADLSVVWVQAKIYEFELPHIEVGQIVEVSIQAEPNRTFPGKIAFVEPVVQEATRTVRVRVEIANPQELLKPGMYADLKIEHQMGEGLLIPESAVLRTGERNICFRSLPEGRFEPVEVKLGSRFGDRFQIVAGLNEGDPIAISAAFLIDSESRLKSTASGAASGHKHGG